MERNEYRGRHSKNDDAWVSSWKQGERKWMKNDMVTYIFLMSEANGSDLAIAVFREEMHNIYWQGRRRSQLSRGHIPWDNGSEIGWLLEMQYLESDSIAILKYIYHVQTKPSIHATFVLTEMCYYYYCRKIHEINNYNTLSSVTYVTSVWLKKKNSVFYLQTNLLE